MRVGLYFGSFNPIHVGHLIIANAMLERTSLDEVWFVVSPQNPFKEKDSLLDDQQRLHMVQLAVEDNEGLRACDIEMHLPTPSYTVVTLAKLQEQYPDMEFSLIMGSDNMDNFHKWRNADYILAHYHIYVYPRPNHLESPTLKHPSVTLMEGFPLMEISSSYIRDEISQGHSVQYLLTPPVWQYLTDRHFYEKTN